MFSFVSSKFTAAFVKFEFVTIRFCEFFNWILKSCNFIVSKIINEESNSPKLKSLSVVFGDISLIRYIPSNIFSSLERWFKTISKVV